MYIVAHGKLMCNAERFRRHLTSSPTCIRCGLEETPLHVLRDCGVCEEDLAASFIFNCSSRLLSYALGDAVESKHQGEEALVLCFRFCFMIHLETTQCKIFKSEEEDN